MYSFKLFLVFTYINNKLFLSVLLWKTEKRRCFLRNFTWIFLHSLRDWFHFQVYLSEFNAPHLSETVALNVFFIRNTLLGLSFSFLTFSQMQLKMSAAGFLYDWCYLWKWKDSLDKQKPGFLPFQCFSRTLKKRTPGNTRCYFPPEYRGKYFLVVGYVILYRNALNYDFHCGHTV